MIKLEHVEKKIRGKKILKGLTCELDDGIYGLLGPNGAGKTTLMRCLANVYRISGGELKMDGRPMWKQKNRVGYLPQTFGLFKELSIWDAMKYFCSLRHVGGDKRNKEIEELLRSVNLYDQRKKQVGKLSGGMLRRLGVAQAMIGNPKLILFDEPTAGLDPEERTRFKTALSNFGKQRTVIISTHIVDDIDACCDSVIVMRDGEILYVGSTDGLKNKASGMVYEVESTFLSDEKKHSYFIEKQYEKNGKIWYRILSATENDFMPAEPTIEDGYTAVIHDISEV